MLGLRSDSRRVALAAEPLTGSHSRRVFAVVLAVATAVAFLAAVPAVSEAAEPEPIDTITVVDDGLPEGDYVGGQMSMAKKDDGFPIFVYENLHENGVNVSVEVTECHDAQCESSETFVILDEDWLGRVRDTALTVAPNGDVLIAAFLSDAAHTAIGYFRCPDGNCDINGMATNFFQWPVNANLTSWDLDIAALPTEPDPTPIVVFDEPGTKAVRMVTCQDLDCADWLHWAVLWGDADDKDLGASIQVEVGEDGLQDIAFRHDLESGALAYDYVECTAASCNVFPDGTASWHENAITQYPEPWPQGGSGSGSLALTTGSDGPAFAYYDVIADQLMVRRCADDACSDSTSHPVFDAADLLAIDQVQVSVSPTHLSLALREDRPVVSFAQEVRGFGEFISNDLFVVACVDPVCAEEEVVTDVDPDGDAPEHVGFFSSVELADDGAAMIGYSDIGNLLWDLDPKVKLATCESCFVPKPPCEVNPDAEECEPNCVKNPDHPDCPEPPLPDCGVVGLDGAFGDPWYLVAAGSGGVVTFPESRHMGDLDGKLAAGESVVDSGIRPDGNGYGLLTSAGRVVIFDENGMSELPATQVVQLEAGETFNAMAFTPKGDGVWVFTSLARSLTYGGADDLGSYVGLELQRPPADAKPGPTHLGDDASYYMFMEDGGVFTPEALLGGEGGPDFYYSLRGYYELGDLFPPMQEFGEQIIGGFVQERCVDGSWRYGYQLGASLGGVFNDRKDPGEHGYTEFCESFPEQQNNIEADTGVRPQLVAPMVDFVANGNCPMFIGGDGGVFMMVGKSEFAQARQPQFLGSAAGMGLDVTTGDSYVPIGWTNDQ